MVPFDIQQYRHVPGILCLIVGLCLVVFAGLSWVDGQQQEYEYQMSGDVYVYEFDELSSDGAVLILEAIDDTAPTVTKPPDRFDRGETATYLVAYNESYHELSTELTEAGNVSITHGVRHGNDIVDEFSSLSESGQGVVRKAAESAGEPVHLDGPLPPEFETGGDAPGIGHGRYYVRYDGNSFLLTVSDSGPDGLAADLLSWWYVFVGAGGLVTAGVGTASAYSGRIRPPVVTLVAVGVLLGSSAVPGVGVVLTPVVAFLATLLVWNLLYWGDIGGQDSSR